MFFTLFYLGLRQTTKLLPSHRYDLFVVLSGYRAQPISQCLVLPARRHRSELCVVANEEEQKRKEKR